MKASVGFKVINFIMQILSCIYVLMCFFAELRGHRGAASGWRTKGSRQDSVGSGKARVGAGISGQSSERAKRQRR